MRRPLILMCTTASALILAACANSEDASTEAQADTVEIPSFEALSNVDELPVADADANTDLGEDDTVPGEDGDVDGDGDPDADDSDGPVAPVSTETPDINTPVLAEEE